MIGSTECDRTRDLLPLRGSDDLTVEQAETVDQHVRYCQQCQDAYAAYQQIAEVMREAASESMPVDQSGSLWQRVEPQLGPAGRLRRRPFGYLSTRQLAAVAAGLALLTIWLEYPRQAEPWQQAQAPRRAGTSLVQPAELEPLRPDVELIRPRLGVLVEPVSPQLQAQQELADRCGAVVVNVLKGSAADRAGLRTGDIIVNVDGKTIRSPAELKHQIIQQPEGSTVRVQLYRQGQLLDITIQLGKSPAPAQFGELPDQGNGRFWLLPGARSSESQMPRVSFS